MTVCCLILYKHVLYKQWLPVDPLSNFIPSHSDVSASAPICRKRAESVWEKNNRFRYITFQGAFIYSCTEEDKQHNV